MHNELESKKGSNLSSMSENNDLNEKLVISKAKYRALFENVPVGSTSKGVLSCLD
jgi:hypothetical protein